MHGTEPSHVALVQSSGPVVFRLRSPDQDPREAERKTPGTRHDTNRENLIMSTQNRSSNRLKSLFTAALFGAVAATSVQADWTAVNIQYLIGPDLEAPSGADPVPLFTFEVANGWKYGDNFFFTDVMNGPKYDSGAKLNTYGEWHSRLSFSKITGKTVALGPITDVLLASELDFAAPTAPFTATTAHLMGVGFNLKLPKFAFFNVDLYVRDEPGVEGVGFQISPYWLLPFSVGPLDMTFGGWVDIMSGEDTQEMWWQMQPTLLADIGKFWGAPGKVMAGMEYEYFSNFLGIKDYKVNHPQFVAMWKL
jgi:nucleoside-specific outer membrane channel protein Tsx